MCGLLFIRFKETVWLLLQKKICTLFELKIIPK